MKDDIYIILEESYRDYNHHVKSPARIYIDNNEAYSEMDRIILDKFEEAISYSSLVEIHKKSLFHMIEDAYSLKDEGNLHYDLGEEELVIHYSYNSVEIFLYKDKGSNYMYRIMLKRISRTTVNKNPFMLMCAGVDYHQFVNFHLQFFTSLHEAKDYMYHHYKDDLTYLTRELTSSRGMLDHIIKEIDQTLIDKHEVISSYHIDGELLMCFIDEGQSYLDLCVDNKNRVYTMDIMQLPI